MNDGGVFRPSGPLARSELTHGLRCGLLVSRRFARRGMAARSPHPVRLMEIRLASIAASAGDHMGWRIPKRLLEFVTAKNPRRRASAVNENPWA